MDTYRNPVARNGDFADPFVLRHDGRYYLTYHRWARRDQVERAYPQMRTFLARKRVYDPEERFQSTWYRHHVALLT